MFSTKINAVLQEAQEIHTSPLTRERVAHVCPTDRCSDVRCARGLYTHTHTHTHNESLREASM